MPVYKYEAEDAFGNTVDGTYEANTEREVEIYLNQAHLEPKEIKRSWLQANIQLQRVKNQDLVVFTRMFAALAKAAVPLDRSLKILHRQADKKPLKEAVQRVIVEVERGSSLADAMRTQPDVFDDLYVNMIEAGEVSGNLDIILDDLAETLERIAEIKSKVVGAMIYPAILVLMAVIVIFVMLNFVLPQIVSVVTDIPGYGRSDLPIFTRVLLSVSEFLQAYWMHMAGGLVLLIVGLKYSGQTEAIRRFWDEHILNVPIIGNVVQKGALARFTRLLATVLSSGVSILDALDLTSESADNHTIVDAIDEVARAIEQGSEIAPPMQAQEVFPPLLTQMVAVGEESGELDSMLSKVAEFYEQEVRKTVDRALTLIEPAMLLVMGGIVAFIVLAMYLPIFEASISVGAGGAMLLWLPWVWFSTSPPGEEEGDEDSASEAPPSGTNQPDSLTT